MTARTAILYSGVQLPDGVVWTGQPVTVRLNTPAAFTTDGLTEIVRTSYAAKTLTGWEITLVINDDIDPAATSWSVQVGSSKWTVQLTAAHAGLRVPLRAVIVVDPTNPNPIIAGVSQAQLTAALAAFTPTGGALDGGDASGTFTGTTIDGGIAA